MVAGEWLALIIFGKFLVIFVAKRLAILTESFRNFSQFLQENSGKVELYIKTGHSHFSILPYSSSIIILPLYATACNLYN
jgi:hypothetical protein